MGTSTSSQGGATGTPFTLLPESKKLRKRNKSFQHRGNQAMKLMTAERQETNEGASVNAQANSLESGRAGRGKAGEPSGLCAERRRRPR